MTTDREIIKRYCGNCGIDKKFPIETSEHCKKCGKFAWIESNNDEIIIRRKDIHSNFVCPKCGKETLKQRSSVELFRFVCTDILCCTGFL